MIAFEHPLIPAATFLELEPPPDLPIELPGMPAQLGAARSAPAKPRFTPAAAPEPTQSQKSSEPIIAPELTSQEATAARAETQQNLDQMEKNLTFTSGRVLNSGQQDLISKVRGFAENAREAMRTGDWVRAKNLSKKAEVLSEQLAASL